MYTTSIGTIVSLMSIVTFVLVGLTRTRKLFRGDDPFFAMAIEPYEDDIIDLWSLGFMFAVENVDPKVGRLDF